MVISALRCLGIFLVGLSIVNCSSAVFSQTTQPKDRPTTNPATPAPASHSKVVEEFAEAIADRHGIAEWVEKDALKSKIDIEFKGQKMLEGTLLLETTGGRTRIDLKSGSSIGFDGEDVWISSADADLPMARFHALTWSYFVAAPMKLKDPGTRLTSEGQLPFKEDKLDVAKLTFASGVGDTPRDWYLCYRDPKDHTLRGLAYIVTYGKTLEEAEKEPHAITYEDLIRVEGVLLAQRWRFWQWSREKGIHGDPIGQATLSELEFVSAPANAFKKPAAGKTVSPPPSAQKKASAKKEDG